MEVLFFWFVLSIVAGVIASNKGRSGFGFFLLSLFLTPLVGIIAALVAMPAAEIEKERAASGHSDEYKKCPMCAEIIKKEAIKCRYCGSDLRVPPTAADAKAAADAAPTHAAARDTLLNAAARTTGALTGQAIGAVTAKKTASGEVIVSSSDGEKTLEEILAADTTTCSKCGKAFPANMRKCPACGHYA